MCLEVLQRVKTRNRQVVPCWAKSTFSLSSTDAHYLIPGNGAIIPALQAYSSAVSEMRTATFARDEACQQSVAIKRFLEPFATVSTVRNLFREIKMLRFLKHENVRLTVIKLPLWPMPHANRKACEFARYFYIAYRRVVCMTLNEHL